jgi:hypothetical protein
MSDPSDKNDFDFEMLRRYGAKWAVLAAMTANMAKKGIAVPPDVFEALKTARGKIESGCFSPCEVGCDLSLVEGPLFSQGYLLDQADFQQWSDLLGEAMQGKLDYQRIMGIPAFDPVKNECRFLGCTCSSKR